MGYYLQTKFHGNLKGLSVFCVDLAWNDPFCSFTLDEGTAQKIEVQHSWKEQLSCSCSVDEGPIKNSEPVFI